MWYMINLNIEWSVRVSYAILDNSNVIYTQTKLWMWDTTNVYVSQHIWLEIHLFTWWCHDMAILSASQAPCERNSLVPGGFSSQYASKHVYFVVGLSHVCPCHGSFYYCDVIMGAMLSQIISVLIVYSTVCSGSDQRKHQSSASLAFVRGIHRGPVNSPHKGH